MRNNLKIGLALGSGGARGFCHVGILQEFEKAGFVPDVLSGCSMGAIAAATYAAGLDLYFLEDYALKIKQSMVADYGSPFFSMGIAKGDRSANMLKKMLGEKRFKDLNMPVAITTCDLTKGEVLSIKSGPVWRAVRASYSIPVVFRPIKMGNRLLVDGGVMERIPVNACRELGADIVIAVDAIGGLKPFNVKNSIVSVAERAYMLFDESAFKYCRSDPDYLIVPDMEKSLFNFNDNEEPILAGRRAALEALPKIFDFIDNYKKTDKKQ